MLSFRTCEVDAEMIIPRTALVRGLFLCLKTMISGHMAACSRSVQIKIFAKKHIDYNFISRDGQIISIVFILSHGLFRTQAQIFFLQSKK